MVLWNSIPWSCKSSASPRFRGGYMRRKHWSLHTSDQQPGSSNIPLKLWGNYFNLETPTELLVSIDLSVGCSRTQKICLWLFYAYMLRSRYTAIKLKEQMMRWKNFKNSRFKKIYTIWKSTGCSIQRSDVEDAEKNLATPQNAITNQSPSI